MPVCVATPTKDQPHRTPTAPWSAAESGGGQPEYEHPDLGNWGVALPIPAMPSTAPLPDLKTGVGLGVRWLSPVGPLRVDFASGLDRPPGSAFRFSFSIGPDL